MSHLMNCSRLPKHSNIANALLTKLFETTTNTDIDFDRFKKSEFQFNSEDLQKRFPHLVPDFMRNLYNQYKWKMKNITVNVEGNNQNFGVINIIRSQSLKDIKTWPNHGVYKLQFKKHQKSVKFSKIFKILRLHRNLFPNIKKSKINNRSLVIFIKLFDNKFNIIREKLISKFSFDYYGWLSIDVSLTYSTEFYLKIDSIWQRNSTQFIKEIYSVKLKAKISQYPYYANLVTFYKNESDQSNSPVNNENSDEKQIHHRSKRGLSPAQYLTSQNQNHCQRYSLIVSFKEVGWNRWIIAPQSYNAYYCKGKCPYPLSDNFNATNHAIIQLLVHGMKDMSIPKPCCVPYQLSPTSLLYLNNDGDALLREFKDMEVDSCSCR